MPQTVRRHVPSLLTLSLGLLLALFALFAAAGTPAVATGPGPHRTTTDASGRGAAVRPAAGAQAASDPVLAAIAPRAARLGLREDVLAMALDAARAARREGVTTSPLLTVIDYSLPSTQQRLWVLDLERREILFHELVAHGQGSGDNFATRFSNRDGSHQTSLGLFLTADTYQGRNGYSMRLHGLEPGINHLALPRTIVVHGAWYVTPEHARTHGRIGRSWGCPALSPQAAKPVIDTIKDGSLLFAYYPEPTWLASSRYLDGQRVASAGVAGVRAAK
jgi:hypothetical protein